MFEMARRQSSAAGNADWYLETGRFGNEFRIGRLGVSVGLDEANAMCAQSRHRRVDGGQKLFIVEQFWCWTHYYGRESAESLGGPIRIARFRTASLLGRVNLTAVLSVSIGLINLFPIPMKAPSVYAYEASPENHAGKSAGGGDAYRLVPLFLLCRWSLPDECFRKSRYRETNPLIQLNFRYDYALSGFLACSYLCFALGLSFDVRAQGEERKLGN